MRTTTNYENYLADTKELIKMAEVLITEHKETFLEDLKLLKKLMVHKANKEMLEPKNIETSAKCIIVFYNVLPYACLSAHKDVKDILLSNQVRVNIPARPPLSSFFTPLDNLVEEVAKLSNMGFDFDNKLVLMRSIETQTGNFIKQFQWNYDMTTTRSDEEITFLKYLSYTEKSMPILDLKELYSSKSDISMDTFMHSVKNNNTTIGKRKLKDLSLEYHYSLSPNDKDKKFLYDFIFGDTIDFIKGETIVCRYRDGHIGNFLLAHKGLIDIIHPNFYDTQILPLIKVGNLRDARNKIKRNLMYKFDKV
jgi:hypothetical protein